METNLPNQIYKTKSTKLNLMSKLFEIDRTKYTEPNIPNQIFSIKPAKLTQPNRFYQIRSKKTKSTENQSIVRLKLELSLTQLSPSLVIVLPNSTSTSSTT